MNFGEALKLLTMTPGLYYAYRDSDKHRWKHINKNLRYVGGELLCCEKHYLVSHSIMLEDITANDWVVEYTEDG